MTKLKMKAGREKMTISELEDSSYPPLKHTPRDSQNQTMKEEGTQSLVSPPVAYIDLSHQSIPRGRQTVTYSKIQVQNPKSQYMYGSFISPSVYNNSLMENLKIKQDNDILSFKLQELEMKLMQSELVQTDSNLRIELEQ
jgi:hypothetical protein